MPIGENHQLIERYYNELWNEWKLDLIGELIARDIEFRGSIGTTVRGADAFREYVLTIRDAFPDFHNTIRELIGEGGRVAARLTYSGTHRGELFGMAGTGAKVRYDGVAIFAIADRRIQSGYVIGDTAALRRQMILGPEECRRDAGMALATRAEEEWAADLMSASEPWITLGRGRALCLRSLRNPAHLLFIAHDEEGRPRGFLLLHPEGVVGAPYVRSIAVDPACRGEGVGTRMLEFAERLFGGKVRDIFLCVSSFNPAARRLYERLGYRMVGEFPDYVIAGASEVLMHKRLV